MKYYFKNGEISEGFYVNGLKEGFGTTFWADNVKEEGNFLNGRKHGEFKMIFANGSVEKSFW
jgi:antitoxin component YwqK of YwqJK toxin-antitoxin module